MYLHRSAAISDLSLTAPLPEGGVKGLFVRFSGTNAAGVAATLADLGNVRVNLKGTDIDNATFNYFSLYNNLKWGVAEFTSVVAGTLAASIYIPFHQPDDNSNCLIVANQNDGYIQLQFPALVAALVASGTVEVYVIPSRGSNSYLSLHLQQNIQAGGAGSTKQSLTSFNIANVYVVDNVIATQYLVTRDGIQSVNASRTALLAKSNLDNRVETAILFFEIPLNPSALLANTYANRVDVQVTTTAAVNLGLVYNSILFSQAFQGRVTSGASGTTIAPTRQGLGTASLVTVATT
jgi:hypothetical protein